MKFSVMGGVDARIYSESVVQEEREKEERLRRDQARRSAQSVLHISNNLDINRLHRVNIFSSVF